MALYMALATAANQNRTVYQLLCCLQAQNVRNNLYERIFLLFIFKNLKFCQQFRYSLGCYLSLSLLGCNLWDPSKYTTNGFATLWVFWFVFGLGDFAWSQRSGIQTTDLWFWYHSGCKQGACQRPLLPLSPRLPGFPVASALGRELPPWLRLRPSSGYPQAVSRGPHSSLGRRRFIFTAFWVEDLGFSFLLPFWSVLSYGKEFFQGTFLWTALFEPSSWILCSKNMVPHPVNFFLNAPTLHGTA